jgi:uncharacterized protein YacL (UPF0231 family)
MVQIMPKRPENSPSKNGDHEIPRWRRIEIMREKAQLREALGDIDAALEDYDEEVFGSDEEYVIFHEHSEIPEEELADIDEEVLPDEDFEDFDED